MQNKEGQNFFFAIRIIIFLIIICVLPIFASKIIKSFTKKDEKLLTKQELNQGIQKYLENNSEIVLRTLLDKYFEIKKQSKSSEEINNAIWIFEKELFNENLPKYPLKNDVEKKISEKPRILILFSDFDLILPIFNEIFNFNPERLNAQIFFRQITTQSKYSANLAASGFAVFKLKPEIFLPFYMDILSIPKKDLNQEKIESILKSFNLNLDEVKKISDLEEIKSEVNRTGQIALEMGIKELPAFIMENGQIFFGPAGMKILRNLYNQNDRPN
jgi:hypothetical protein